MPWFLIFHRIKTQREFTKSDSERALSDDRYVAEILPMWPLTSSKELISQYILSALMEQKR